MFLVLVLTDLPVNITVTLLGPGGKPSNPVFSRSCRAHLGLVVAWLSPTYNRRLALNGFL